MHQIGNYYIISFLGGSNPLSIASYSFNSDTLPCLQVLSSGLPIVLFHSRIMDTGGYTIELIYILDCKMWAQVLRSVSVRSNTALKNLAYLQRKFHSRALVLQLQHFVGCMTDTWESFTFLCERNVRLHVTARTNISSLSCGDLYYIKHVPSEVLLLCPKVRKSKPSLSLSLSAPPPKKKFKDLICFLTSTPVKIMNAKDGLV